MSESGAKVTSGQKQIQKPKGTGLRENVIISPSGKIPAIGMGLEEIIATGLGISINSPFGLIVSGDIGFTVLDVATDVKMYYYKTINYNTNKTGVTIYGLVKLREEVPFEQSQFYKETVSAWTEARLPWDQAFAGDIAFLVSDFGLYFASKGEYRKAVRNTAFVDIGLAVKDFVGRWYTDSHAESIMHSVARPESDPYPNFQEAANAVYNMKDQKLIPFLNAMKDWGYLKPILGDLSDWLMKHSISGQLLLNIVLRTFFAAYFFGKAYSYYKKKDVNVGKEDVTNTL